jgi:hypothetical protein
MSGSKDWQAGSESPAQNTSFSRSFLRFPAYDE